MTRLPLNLIRMDGGTQLPDHINIDVVKSYAEAITSGTEFPPVTVFFDSEHYWLADGYHRVTAWKLLGWIEVPVEVRSGTIRDAQWYSFSVNTTQGKSRGRNYIANILYRIFRDDEWRAVPVRDIAAHTGVSESVVLEHRNLYHGQRPNGFSTILADRQGCSDYDVPQLSGSPAAVVWEQIDLEKFTESRQSCASCAYCEWRLVFDGWECAALGKQTWPDSIIGLSCAFWMPADGEEELVVVANDPCLGQDARVAVN